MKATELRRKYIDFFISNHHKEISGKSLFPENDPTVLFTTAGMHPLVPYILGEEHPAGNRLVNAQKCIRTGDIDAVGDPSHLTYFEMLGNWSLGDYFKAEALSMSHTFLTSSEWLNLDADRLSVTVFSGDDDAPRDNEAAVIWSDLGIPEQRIHFLAKEDNWWGPAGKTGPCGPDSEMFYDTGKEACSSECRPGCSCGKYFEVWNDVFMQYEKREDGSFVPLERRCVDTGMGIERTTAMLQGKRSVFEIELFTPLIAAVEELSKSRYGGSEENEKDRMVRIICDHARAATMILCDPNGVSPSNLGQGYILRRLIRRGVRCGRKLGINHPFFAELAAEVAKSYSDFYPEVGETLSSAADELTREEELFHATLEKGEREWGKRLPNLLKNPQKKVPGRLAFQLYDTYGFPVELTEELAAEEGMTIDRNEFEAAFEKHREASKKGVNRVFKGGLADNSEKTTAYHTATHLLHEALRRVLGEHVDQKGSNITAERLRFDFTHTEPMTDEQKQKVEGMVNEIILQDLPITMKLMSLEEARNLGARALFEGKYDEEVKVYSIGDFSTEVCGGPHVEHTRTLGKFKLKKEQSSSRGVRRIRAVLEETK